jgi:hypothetical protein
VVEAVGEEVTMFKDGDRVAPVFPQGHHYVSQIIFLLLSITISISMLILMSTSEPRLTPDRKKT